MDQNITITGYVGRDREIRYTKTWTRDVPSREVSDDDYEYTVPEYTVEGGGNEYVVLSVATNRKIGSRWETQWHRVIAWNTDRGARHPARLCQKGFKVRIDGHLDTFTTGNGRTVEQIIVDDLKIVKWKAREYN